MAAGDSWTIEVRITERGPNEHGLPTHDVGVKLPPGLPPTALASTAGTFLVCCARTLHGGPERVVEQIAKDAIENLHRYYSGAQPPRPAP